jgi:hypothetical protein
MLPWVLLLLAVPSGPAVEGRPLFYWGARPPLLEVDPTGPPGSEARNTEIHAAFDRGDLVLRWTFDRPVREALALPDGTPVSGRLRSVVYIDADDDTRTGTRGGSDDLTAGSELRLELGAVTLGEDPEEKRTATSLLVATLVSLTPEGRRRVVWRVDDQGEPGRLSRHGEWVELRVPIELAQIRPGSRLVLLSGGRPVSGRLR